MITQCRTACIKGYVNSYGECVDTCQESTYKQDKFGNCNYCHSSYDGGLFKQPICGKATLCRPSCPYNFVDPDDPKLCMMITEEGCEEEEEKEETIPCPCAKKVNVTITDENGEEKVVEETMGYYTLVEEEIDDNGEKRIEVQRICVE